MNIDNLILLEYQRILEDSKVDNLKQKKKELQDAFDNMENPDRKESITKKRAALKDQIDKLAKQIDSSKEDPEKEAADKEKEIEKLTNEIEATKERLSRMQDARNESIIELKNRTDSFATNELLQKFVSKQRLKGIIAFNEKILSMMNSEAQKKEVEERLSKMKADDAENEKAFDEASSKADEQNKDDEKYQEAKKAAEKEETDLPTDEPTDTEPTDDESSDEPAETSKVVNKEPKKEEPAETSKVVNKEPKSEEPKKEEPKAEEPKKEKPKKAEPKSEEPKSEEPKSEKPKAEEPKKEEIDYKLDVLQKKLKGTKMASKKAADSGNDKAFDAISANVKAIQNALDQLKKDKENLGESFEGIENQIWAIDWMIENLLYQIDNELYPIND
jgi:hypothetical protein